MRIRQAVILAGGQGKRLRPLTYKIPKPMVPVNGRPFLEHLIDLLKKNGIEEVLFLLGYLPEKIIKHFGDGSRFGINIKYWIDKVSEETITGTRLRNSKNLLDDYFLLMYGDNYWPLDLRRLIEYYSENKTLAQLTAYSNKEGLTRNNVLIDKEGYVRKYDKDRKDKNLNAVEIGFFILKKRILELMPNADFSFEHVMLPLLSNMGQLRGYITDHRYYSIADPSRLKITEKFLKPKKIVFLDRDGVVNKKPPRWQYIKKWSEFEFLPNTIEALSFLSQKGYQIYLVSNQAGIARGKMTRRDLENIHKRMKEVLKRNKVKINGIYYCPHGWDEGCECRKPKPGLLYQAAREHHFDLTKAILIGDSDADREAGEAVGCRTVQMEGDGDLLGLVKGLVSNL